MPYKNIEDRRAAYRRNYADNKAARQAQQAIYRRDRRAAVIAHYGGSCACCGETQLEFLSIDHIDGGGTQHRAEIKEPIERWLIRNGYPNGYRVLCHNCNQAMGWYGSCPHQAPLV